MWYILDEDNNPIKCTDHNDYHEWMENNPERKIVKQDRVEGTLISTVFLGLDHNTVWDDYGSPVLWETMIFEHPEYEGYQERYTSYLDAVEGHIKALHLIYSNPRKSL